MRTMPFQDAKWFFGIVEGVNDPLRLGRVQVRSFGVHSDQKKKSPLEGIPSDELIWAQVAGSPMDGRMHGIGNGPHKLVGGTQVMGIFLDGENAQLPIVLFVIGTKTPENKPDPNLGFSDPAGIYPKELDVPHLSPLATSPGQSTPIGTEPESKANPVYPFNQVRTSISGHVIEVDDTPGAERVKVTHRTGSYVVINPDGSIVVKSTNRNDVIDGSMVTEVTGTDLEYIHSNKHLKAPRIDLGMEGGLEPSVLGDKLAAYFDSLATWLDEHHHGGPPPVSPWRPSADPGLSGGNVYSKVNRNQ